ncbi:hypothetical protein SCAR479_13711 [Seiridium cardinale]
MRILKYG